MERPLDFIESNVNVYRGRLLICDSYVHDIAKGAHWEMVADTQFGQIAEQYTIRSFCPEKTLLDVL